MPLTANSDVMGRFHENAFNRIISEIMFQRPKLFNYATEGVIKNNRFCAPIKINSALEKMGVEKATRMDKLPIIGSDDASHGIEYSVQIRELKVDFTPESTIQLPPELGNLSAQQFALKGKVCAGLGCNQTIRFPFVFDGGIAPVGNVNITPITTGLTFFPTTLLKMHCFCLDLFAKAIIVRSDTHIQLKLVGIELQDIRPLGLENSIECYLHQMLDHAVFPKVKMAIDDLVFDAGSYFSIGLTPTSPALPYNPDVSNNALSIFLNLI